jgi:hypothetical protein
MAKYIGNIPSVGEFKKLDSLTSTFNGSLTQFDLEYGSTSVSVGDASQLIVSLNGIIQEPLTAYTLAVGGSAIVFSSAPASTDTCHIILLGGVGGTSTVSDGAVTAAKLDAGLKDYLEETYTANGSQTTYALTRAPIGTNDLMITIDGIVQPSTAYSIAGTTLTISPALPNGTDVRVVHMGVRAGFVVPSSSSITAAMFQDFTTDVKFNDNAKAVFGTGDDLQIYHSGTHSWITNSTGYLHINAANIELKNAADNETMLLATQNGAVKLSYDNSVKLATTATGIDVTGSVTSDGLTVDGDAIIQDATPTLEFKDTDNNLIASIAGASGSLLLKADTGGGTSGESMQFHTGGTERMRIDASGNVGIGTAPSATYSAFSTIEFATASIISQNTATGGASPDGNLVLGSNMNYSSGGGPEYKFTGKATQITQIDGNITLGVATSGTANTNITYNTGLEVLNDGYARAKNGLLFGTDTGAANALDDYEEGSWTPSMSGMGNATFSQQFGRYTKIGDLVHVTGKIEWTGANGTAQVSITGLPFTATLTSDTQLRNSAWPQGDYRNINTLIQRNGHFRVAGATLFGVIDNTSGFTTGMNCTTHVSSFGEFNFYLVYKST